MKVTAALALVLALLPAASHAFADGGDVAKAKDLLAKKDYSAARDLLVKIAGEGTTDGEVLLVLGKAQVGCGEFDAAVSTLVKATDKRANDYDSLLALGQALTEQAREHARNGDFEGAGFAFTDARRFLEEASKANPKAVEPLLLAARGVGENGDPEGALALAEEALGRDSKSVEALLEVGARRYFGAQFKQSSGDGTGAKALREKCKEAYNSALALDPQNGQVWNGLGWLALATNEKEKGVEAFAKSVELTPTQNDSYRQLAALLGDSKEKRTQLLGILDKAVIKSKTFASGDERKLAQGLAYFYRGRVKGALRDTKGLDADMKDASEAMPDLKFAAALEVSLALYATAAYDLAAARLTPLTESNLDALVAAVLAGVDPAGNLMSLRGLADQLVKANKNEAAREIFRLVANAQQNNADDWNNYAFFCRETGKYEESYAAYEKAVELRPTDPSILNDTALILQYHLHRDLEHALDLYMRAIEEGNKVLADKKADGFSTEAAQTAVRDATNNSAKLRAELGK